MKRLFANSRPFGPVTEFAQLGGDNLISERKKGANIGDSLVGRMKVRIVG